MPRSSKEQTLLKRHQAFGFWIRGVPLAEIAHRLDCSPRHARRLINDQLQDNREARDSLVGEDDLAVALASYDAVLAECWKEIHNPPRDDNGKVKRDAPKVSYLTLATTVITRRSKLLGLDKEQISVDVKESIDWEGMMRAVGSRRGQKEIVDAEVDKPLSLPKPRKGADTIDIA